MIRTAPRCAILLTLTWLACSAQPALAEWFLDLYGGISLLESSPVSLNKDTTGAGISTSFIDITLKEVDFDDFPTAGLRVGYWFDTAPSLGVDLGVGLDTFLFQLTLPRQTVLADSNVDIIGTANNEPFAIQAGTDISTQLPPIDTDGTPVVSLELMIRRPLLTTPDFPKGRLQPYLTVAPALLVNSDDLDMTLGVKVGIGLSWQIFQHVALMAEYRFTHFNLNITNVNLTAEGVAISQLDLSVDLNMHLYIAGISIRL